MVCRSDFQYHKNFSENKCSIKSLKNLSLHYVCHDILLPQRSLSETKYAMSWLLTLFLPIFSSYMLESTFSALYIITSCMSTFLSHTFFLIFSWSLAFWIKPLSFLSMTTLFCFPCHKNCLTVISFIYSPTTHSVQLVLTNVGFLKAHLSTNIAPSTSSHYLG